jgi:hypothetical protein
MFTASSLAAVFFPIPLIFSNSIKGLIFSVFSLVLSASPELCLNVFSFGRLEFSVLFLLITTTIGTNARMMLAITLREPTKSRGISRKAMCYLIVSMFLGSSSIKDTFMDNFSYFIKA